MPSVNLKDGKKIITPLLLVLSPYILYQKNTGGSILSLCVSQYVCVRVCNLNWK